MVHIVIPVGPYHKGLAGDAIASAQAQTVSCEVTVIEDTQGRGAGWARNQGWRRRDSLFTVFLDADDLLAPTFVERTLAAYQTPHYVYTDWQTEDGEIVRPPDRTDLPGWYTGRVFHTVSVLMPTALLKAVGGFDETLVAMEETDLFLRLRLYGVCGLRCPEVLMTYTTRGGKRAQTARETGEAERLRTWLKTQYGGFMGCGCTGSANGNAAPQNEKQAGDVLALSLWAGNHSVVGMFTARRYRGGNGRRVWIHPEDARLDPDHWSVVFNPMDITPKVEDVLAMAGQALANP